jgi:hypothetical protein
MYRRFANMFGTKPNKNNTRKGIVTRTDQRLSNRASRGKISRAKNLGSQYPIDSRSPQVAFTKKQMNQYNPSPMISIPKSIPRSNSRSASRSKSRSKYASASRTALTSRNKKNLKRLEQIKEH